MIMSIIGMGVRDFMLTCGQNAPAMPVMLDKKTWELRTDLIAEEAAELEKAYRENDMAGFLDACVDLVYVVVGTAVAAGLPFDEAFDEVHKANMDKAVECDVCDGEGSVWTEGVHIDGHASDCPKCEGLGMMVKRRKDGKILKPDGWVAPDIQGVIDRVSKR